MPTPASSGLPEQVKRQRKTLCQTLEIGEPTLLDIVSELCKPGRDVRDSLPKPQLRSDVMGMEDLKPGMVLTGTVRNVIDQIGTQSRGTQSSNFYVVKHTDMPATLVEVAFISNPQEEQLLNSEEGIQKAAQGIADGIADYFG